MDIAKIKTEETHFDDSVECPLYDDAGQPEVDSAQQPVVVLVVSEYSTSARRTAQTQKQTVSKLIRRYGAWDAVPQSDLEDLDNRRIASCITGWRGFESAGTPLPFSTDTAVAVIAGLRDKKPRTLKQIEGAIAAHASFFTTASAA